MHDIGDPENGKYGRKKKMKKHIVGLHNGPY